MNRRKKLIVGGIVALAVIGGGTGIAIATGLGDDGANEHEDEGAADDD